MSQSKTDPLITPPPLMYTHFPKDGLGSDMTDVSTGPVTEAYAEGSAHEIQ